MAETIRQGKRGLSAMPSASASSALAIADDGLPVLRRDPSLKGPAPTLEQVLTLEQNAFTEEDRLRGGFSD